MIEEMRKFREYLDKENIEWMDASEPGMFSMTRTHFRHRGYSWSVIHGIGSYGEDAGLLELMSGAANRGEPLGWLKAEDAIRIVKGDDK